MLQLSQRPLSSSDIDAELFVDRERELRTLARAYRLSFNALALAERGAGITTLARQLQRVLEADGVETHYCDITNLTTVDEFIAAVQRSLRGISGPKWGDRAFHEEIIADHEQQMQIRDPDTEWRLIRLGDGIKGRPLMVIDGAHEPQLIHTMFGRYRDQMWELPFTWLVCGLPDRRKGYLQPPADAFFDTQLRLDQFDDDIARQLLSRRIDQASDRDIEVSARIRANLEFIVGSSNGSPRQLLAAAREIAIGTDDTAGEVEHLFEAAAKIGRPAAMLTAELRALGSASASDDELLSRLGWTRARATQVFKQLLEAGIVTSGHERVPGSSGRPKTVYTLNTNVGVGT